MFYDFLELLPYSPSTVLNSLSERIRLLKILIFIHHSAIETTKSFINKDYAAFDAQVSENLCQIRAYYLLLLTETHNDDHKNDLLLLFQKIKSTLQQCKSLLDKYLELQQIRPSHYTKSIHQSITIQELFDEFNIRIELNESQFFLIQTHILSRFKLISDYNVSLGINYDVFCVELGISSKTMARKLIHRFQRNISKLSCQFMFKLLFDLGLDSYHNFLLNSLYCQDEVERHVIACYEVTSLLLKHAYLKNKNIKLVIHSLVDNSESPMVFVFKPSIEDKRYKLVFSKDASEMNQYSMIITGIVRNQQLIAETKEEYIARLLEVELEDIILCNMAQHPQYAGLLLDSKKYNPYEQIDASSLPDSYSDYIAKAERQFLKHKFLAPQIGCSADNPSLFLITHIAMGSKAHIYEPEELEAELY